jgi:hypothetical protein
MTVSLCHSDFRSFPANFFCATQTLLSVDPDFPRHGPPHSHTRLPPSLFTFRHLSSSSARIMGVAHSRETSVLTYIQEGTGAGEEDRRWSELPLSAVADIASARALLRATNVPVFGGTVRSLLLAPVAGSGSATGTNASSRTPGASASAATIAIGSKVRLADGFESVSDAALGPLRPGNVGTVLKTRLGGEETSFNVKAANGKTWWYRRNAIRIAAESGPLAIGSKVVLRRGFGAEGDAGGGPLSVGDVGEIIGHDGSSKPWKVKGNAGKTWCVALWLLAS